MENLVTTMDMVFNDIYRGKKVFITGHTGFKGSWLAHWLTKIGAEVVGYSLNPPSEPNHFTLLNSDYKSITGDILDKEKLSNSIGDFQPDIVFHLAAQALVRDSYLFPVKTFETNIIGTANVLETCREKSVKAIINVTSDKCYQNNNLSRGYHENDPMGGNDPYSASKGCAELVGNAFRKSFFNIDQYGRTHNTLLGDVRAGNVIGGGDWAKDRLIPDIVRAATKNEVVKVRSPKAIRPWQHVLEPISGYLHLGWKLLDGKSEFADNWNFGPADDLALTVEEVVHHLQEHWDKIKFDIEPDANNFYEASILLLDSRKARKQLGWDTVWGVDETFSRTAEWYKNFYQNNGQLTTDNDLEQYVRDAKEKSVGWAV